MKQEDKELLLKDLCTRLPYGVNIKDDYGDIIHVNIYNAHIEHLIDRISLGIDKMVLRSLSSMTEEERETYLLFSYARCNDKAFDWLNAHHFDYRGLIGKGLALEAPKRMY